MNKRIVFEFNITMTSQKEYQIDIKEETENVFSCKIDDVEFTPCTPLKGSPALFGGYSNNFTIIRITAKCTNINPFKYVIIELNNFQGLGDYDLSDTNNECRYEEFYPDNIYKSTLTKQGKVTITKDDRINFILSGTFEFTAENTIGSSDLVTVTNGHFDLKF